MKRTTFRYLHLTILPMVFSTLPAAAASIHYATSTSISSANTIPRQQDDQSAVWDDSNGPLNSGPLLGFFHPSLLSSLSYDYGYVAQMSALSRADVWGNVDVSARTYSWEGYTGATYATSSWTLDTVNPLAEATSFPLHLSFGSGYLTTARGTLPQLSDEPSIETDIRLTVNGNEIWHSVTSLGWSKGVSAFGTSNYPWYLDSLSPDYATYRAEPFTVMLATGVIQPGAPVNISYTMYISAGAYHTGPLLGGAGAAGYISDPFTVGAGSETPSASYGISGFESLVTSPEPATVWTGLLLLLIPSIARGRKRSSRF